ncbi:hypothetical protein ACFE04_029012 [Oxalis oulophora]
MAMYWNVVAPYSYLFVYASDEGELGNIRIQSRLIFNNLLKMQELQNRVTKAGGSKEELMSVGTEIVLLHGEMLARQPFFLKETNPQPKKYILWQATTDVNNGQASIHR